MKIICLLIPFFYGLFELIRVVCGLEKGKYIYNNKEHSIEHFIYLLSYILSLFILIMYIYSRDEIILDYFIFMLSFSSVALIRHIQKERLNK